MFRTAKTRKVSSRENLSAYGIHPLPQAVHSLSLTCLVIMNQLRNCTVVRRQGEKSKVVRHVCPKVRQGECSLRNVRIIPFLDQSQFSAVYGIHGVKIRLNLIGRRHVEVVAGRRWVGAVAMDTRMCSLIVIHEGWVCKEDVALVWRQVIEEASDLVNVPSGTMRRGEEVCRVFDSSHGVC